jgi:hypothetical protein
VRRRRDRHGAGNHEWAKGIGDARGREQSATQLARARDGGHQLSRFHAHLVESGSGCFEAVTPKGSKKLLGPMNGEIATKNHPGKEQTDVTHDELLNKSIALRRHALLSLQSYLT